MPLNYKQWLEILFKDLQKKGINATLESDGSITCEKDGHTKMTTEAAAYTKYREYLIKYPD